MAGSRGDAAGGGEAAGTDRILTTLLTEMDGIEEMHGVTVVAATNRPEAIVSNSAILSPQSCEVLPRVCIKA